MDSPVPVIFVKALLRIHILFKALFRCSYRCFRPFLGVPILFVKALTALSREIMRDMRYGIHDIMFTEFNCLVTCPYCDIAVTSVLIWVGTCTNTDVPQGHDILSWWLQSCWMHPLAFWMGGCERTSVCTYVSFSIVILAKRVGLQKGKSLYNPLFEPKYSPKYSL